MPRNIYLVLLRWWIFWIYNTRIIILKYVILTTITRRFLWYSFWTQFALFAEHWIRFSFCWWNSLFLRSWILLLKLVFLYFIIVLLNIRRCILLYFHQIFLFLLRWITLFLILDYFYLVYIFVLYASHNKGRITCSVGILFIGIFYFGSSWAITQWITVLLRLSIIFNLFLIFTIRI